MSFAWKGWSIPLLAERPLLARMRSGEQRHVRLLPSGKQTVAPLSMTGEFDPKQSWRVIP